MPPTLDRIIAEVIDRVGLTLHDVGLYLDGPAGSTRVALAGVRRGLAAVCVAPADPFALADGDVANLSSFALERVFDEAEFHALRIALQRWDLALATAGMPALAKAGEMDGGTVQERKRLTRARVTELAAACSTPYREPAEPLVRAAAEPAEPGYPYLGGFPCGDDLL